MSHSCKIILDSISPNGVRLTTFEMTFPRIVLAEFNTHRVFARNSASSRAIPVQKMLKMAEEDPYIPTYWGKNQKGMQSEEEVDAHTAEEAQHQWLRGRDAAVERARNLLDLGIHKQFTNRLLEPYLWHTVIVTATEWDNFFHLRNNPKAHPDIQIPARSAQELYKNSTPKLVRHGGWHLPYVQDEDWDLMREHLGFSTDATSISHPEVGESMVMISAARCARVSYLTHDGKRDVAEDLALYDKLLEPGHMSPFEHPARPATEQDNGFIDLKKFDGARTPPEDMWFGNFRGWVQHRKEIPGEKDILGYRRANA